MLKQIDSNQLKRLHQNKLLDKTGDKCGKLENTDVCKLPFGGCNKQQKADGNPNSFTLCSWAHKQLLK
ncbi:Uncharacterised protein [uncultured archaeon]|nr:Uncharacterised protein [uncultured archaeon]